MTDNEIIKALECCAGDVTCDDCPIVNECSVHPTKNTLASFALSLINRQNAEVERLKTECGLAKFDKYKAEFEEFRAEIKAEAIKEFAERLKEYREIVSYDRDFDAYVYGSHIHIDIDEFENLVKEIAGEQ